jgi:hypothetical protein
MLKLHKSIFLALLPFLLLLSGCATAYKPQGPMGGYSDMQFDKNTIEVSFRGNGYTSQETVEHYLLYRCAEVTIEHGYDYFVMADNHTDANLSFITTPSTYTATSNGYTSGFGNSNSTFITGNTTTTGTYYPGQIIPMHKYKSTVVIKMFKGKKPENLPNTYNARELIKYMSPNIQKNSYSEQSVSQALKQNNNPSDNVNETNTYQSGSSKVNLIKKIEFSGTGSTGPREQSQ